METEKLLIWNAVEKTDKAFTKKFNRAGFKGDAINPCYVAKRLTEMFGPCGIGWRLVLEDEKYVLGKTLSNGDRSINHVVRCHLEYRIDVGAAEWYATGPQYGQTFFVGEHTSAGVFCDEEAPKKSITDCLGKCAVLLGFGADIHLGLWDANKYVNQPSVDSGPSSVAKDNGQRTTDNPPLPPNFDRWFSEQFAEYLAQNAPTVADLARIYDQAAGMKELYEALDHWTAFFNAAAAHFKAIDDKKTTPIRSALVAQLNAESKRLKTPKDTKKKP